MVDVANNGDHPHHMHHVYVYLLNIKYSTMHFFFIVKQLLFF